MDERIYRTWKKTNMRPFKILGVQQIAVGGEDKKNSKLFGWISSDLKNGNV
ncbi:hypothetical protein LEP1GSC161_0388 [Leptospira santarosai str. CBC1416]|uniref:Uncharacterized protein n=1 Tax=Leptospira santarosai str. CBC1416 TaxID=1193059 RepID=M6VI62_9LEPT|nr:hypothetical protein LEP1GSC161_0388 [Leptospira santarosai str. CBC1416]